MTGKNVKMTIKYHGKNWTIDWPQAELDWDYTKWGKYGKKLGGI